MQLQTILSLAALGLASLVRGDACVESGPAAEVTAVSYCCAKVSGTWYQFYPVQAICVFDSVHLNAYKACVSYVPGAKNPTCIPGSGGLGDLTSAEALTSTDAPRETITGSY